MPRGKSISDLTPEELWENIQRCKRQLASYKDIDSPASKNVKSERQRWSIIQILQGILGDLTD